MNDFWSLLVFTLLGQAAAGLFWLIACKEPYLTGKAHILAIILMGAATLASFLHLSDPFVSYYTITNAGTSWLSREILSVGAFGLLLLAAYVFRRGPGGRPLRWLAALAGVAYIWVMSRLYMLPTQPHWDTWLTPAAFFTAALLLGSTLALLLLSVEAGREDRATAKAPVEAVSAERICLLLAVASAFRLLLVFFQAPLPPQACALLLPFQCGLLAAGGLIGPLFLVRRAVWSQTGAGPLPWVVICLLCVWASEVCGRIIFYTSYTHFGM